MSLTFVCIPNPYESRLEGKSGPGTRLKILLNGTYSFFEYVCKLMSSRNSAFCMSWSKILYPCILHSPVALPLRYRHYRAMGSG